MCSAWSLCVSPYDSKGGLFSALLALLSLFLTLRLLLTVLCSVLSFGLFFLSFLPTLCFVISSAPSGWSVLFPLLVFRLGIFLLCSLFCGVLPLNPSLLALSATLSGRFSFCFLSPPLLELGELQALSSQVSSSGDEFRAKTESSVRPLPCSFPVRSLRDFVGSLPDELLLCPVRALRLYLSHAASLPSRPRSLFGSPRAPSCSLSKNALSFFIREVIAEAYSSAGRSLPSASSLSSSCLFLFSFSSSAFDSCAWCSRVRGFLGLSP